MFFARLMHSNLERRCTDCMCQRPVSQSPETLRGYFGCHNPLYLDNA